MSAYVTEAPTPLVTVAEAARALGCTRSAIYGWVQDGSLDASAVLRLGAGTRRGIRIRAWWVEAYLRSGKMPRPRQVGGRR